MRRRTTSVEENLAGDSPDAATDHECGGGSKAFFGIPRSDEDSAEVLGRGEEPGG